MAASPESPISPFWTLRPVVQYSLDTGLDWIKRCVSVLSVSEKADGSRSCARGTHAHFFDCTGWRLFATSPPRDPATPEQKHSLPVLGQQRPLSVPLQPLSGAGLLPVAFGRAR